MNAQQWQPIDTAPKDGTHILAYHKLLPTPIVVNCEKDYGWHDSYGNLVLLDGELTHWMHLPSPPTGTTEA